MITSDHIIVKKHIVGVSLKFLLVSFMGMFSMLVCQDSSDRILIAHECSNTNVSFIINQFPKKDPFQTSLKVI